MLLHSYSGFIVSLGIIKDCNSLSVPGPAAFEPLDLKLFSDGITAITQYRRISISHYNAHIIKKKEGILQIWNTKHLHSSLFLYCLQHLQLNCLTAYTALRQLSELFHKIPYSVSPASLLINSICSRIFFSYPFSDGS